MSFKLNIKAPTLMRELSWLLLYINMYRSHAMPPAPALQLNNNEATLPFFFNTGELFLILYSSQSHQKCTKRGKMFRFDSYLFAYNWALNGGGIGWRKGTGINLNYLRKCDTLWHFFVAISWTAIRMELMAPHRKQSEIFIATHFKGVGVGGRWR